MVNGGGDARKNGISSGRSTSSKMRMFSKNFPISRTNEGGRTTFRRKGRVQDSLQKAGANGTESIQQEKLPGRKSSKRLPWRQLKATRAFRFYLRKENSLKKPLDERRKARYSVRRAVGGDIRVMSGAVETLQYRKRLTL